MTKEQIFELLKDSISSLTGRSVTDSTEKWNAYKLQVDRITKEVASLNKEDMLWLENAYAQWFKDNVPRAKEMRDKMIEMGFGDR